jgi:hypothetical protein
MGRIVRTVREVFLEGLASITLVVCFCGHYDGLKRQAQREMGILKGSTTTRFWDKGAGTTTQTARREEGRAGRPTYFIAFRARLLRTRPGRPTIML